MTQLILGTFVFGLAVWAFALLYQSLKDSSRWISDAPDSADVPVETAASARAQLIAKLNDKRIRSTFVDFDHEVDQSELVQFYREYIASSIEFLSLAEDDVLIVDYIAHGISLNKFISDAKFQKEIGGLYKQYYSKLEELLADKKLPYRRVLQLPVEASGSKEPINDSFKIAFHMQIEHIKRCFAHDNFKLFILKNPRRSNGVIILDRQYILSEHDQISREGCMPDLAIIDIGGQYNKRNQLYISSQLKLYERACADANAAVSRAEFHERYEHFTKRMEEASTVESVQQGIGELAGM
jgi:hypothetical protein